MGTRYTSQSAVGYNSASPPDDGTTVAANKITWATIKTKLADSLKGLADAINSALVTALDTSARAVSTNDTAVATDHWKTLQVTGTTTITLSDASTMGAGYQVTIANAGVNTVTVARATVGDTINGTSADVTIPAKASATFSVNAAADGYNVTGSYGVSFGTLTSASLTSGRIPRASTGGLIIDDANSPTLDASGNVAVIGQLTVDGVSTLIDIRQEKAADTNFYALTATNTKASSTANDVRLQFSTRNAAAADKAVLGVAANLNVTTAGQENGSVGLSTSVQGATANFLSFVASQGGSHILSLGALTQPSTSAAVKFGYFGGGTQYGMALRTANDTTHAIEFERADGTAVGSISITTTGTAFNTSCDARLKDNFRPIPNVVEVLTGAAPVLFDWTITDSPADKVGVGYKAQDLYNFIPLAVWKGDEDPAKRLGDEGFQQWQVDKSNVVPYLHAGWQNHQARLVAAESKAAALAALLVAKGILTQSEVDAL